MSTVLLILASIIGIAVTIFYLRRNLRHIKAKNENEPSKAKRIMNYPLTVIWYAYLLFFFVGLTINNLIF